MTEATSGKATASICLQAIRCCWNTRPRGTTYYTRLKNFKTEQLAKVNFTLGTAGASLVFTNKETGATYEPANGASSIVLPAGTYTYTASKFGCEDATGEFTVAGGETKNITVPALTELKNATVTFHVTCRRTAEALHCRHPQGRRDRL